MAGLEQLVRWFFVALDSGDISFDQLSFQSRLGLA
jgi:hypothetical protein